MDKLFLVVLASLFVAARCYPSRMQRESSEEKDVEMVPEKETFARVPLTRVAVPFGFNYRHQFPFSDSDDFNFGAPAPWPPMNTPHFGDFPAMPMGGHFQNPFQNMFSEMEGMLRHMKKEMDEIASRAGTGTTVQISGNEFDPNKMQNKTITKTEVIDGVVVQTNETTYTSGDAKNGSFFKVKVIEFRPKDESTFGSAENPKYPQEDKPKRPDVEMLSPSTTSKSSLDSGKREELDSENEIPKNVSNESDLKA